MAHDAIVPAARHPYGAASRQPGTTPQATRSLAIYRHGCRWPLPRSSRSTLPTATRLPPLHDRPNPAIAATSHANPSHRAGHSTNTTDAWKPMKTKATHHTRLQPSPRRPHASDTTIHAPMKPWFAQTPAPDLHPTTAST